MKKLQITKSHQKSKTPPLDEFLKEASKLRKFPVYRHSLENFLTFLRENQPVDLWALIKSSDDYIRIIMELLEKLKSEKLISIDKTGKIKLTTSGLNFAEPLVSKTTPLSLKQNLHKYGLTLTPQFKKILKVMKSIYSEILLYSEVVSKDEYDQAPLLPDSAVYKVSYIVNKGDVAGKEIVCIGDDDLVSIILGLTHLPKSILALDVDKQILGIIEKYSKKFNLNVETCEHDLRKAIPGKISHKFDVFITEPPDTVKGITTFVSRGVELLKNEPGMIGYCGISLTACPPLGLLKMQENFMKMGLMITDWLPKFDEYPPVRTELKHVEVPDFYYRFYPPKKVWYISDLVRLKSSKRVKPLYPSRIEGKLSNYNEDAKNFQ